MTITVTEISKDEFYSRLLVFIKQEEDSRQQPYIDTSKLGGPHPTIGIGFDLTNATVRTLVFNAMNVADNVRASLINIINNPPASETTLQNQFNAAYGKPFVMTSAQIDSVYQSTVTDKVNSAKSKSGLPYSDELIALSSLQFNGLYGDGLQKALDIPDPYEARAEAWYQIRYIHAVDQNESRRYSEASVFGLYENPTGTVSIEEALAVYKMYTRHYADHYQDKYGADNDGMIHYDVTKAHDIFNSNGDLNEMAKSDPAFTIYHTQSLEFELHRAAETIETEYLKPENLTLGSINPLNIQVAYDDANNPVVNLIGEDNITRTGHIDDLLIGDASANTLQGQSGNDILLGEGGDDTLNGGTNNDTLIGGQGSDTYIFTQGDGVDTIIDSDGSGQIIWDLVNIQGDANALSDKWKKFNPNVWQDQRNPQDLISYDLQTEANGSQTLYIFKNGDLVKVDNWQPGDLGISLGAGAQPLTPLRTYNGDQRAPVTVSNGKETYDWSATSWATDGTLTGGIAEENFNDVITGSTQADKINGLGGNDALDGGAGNDQIDGGEGNDLIAGGAGSDIIHGGAGNDQILSATGLAVSQRKGPNDVWQDFWSTSSGVSTWIEGST